MMKERYCKRCYQRGSYMQVEGLGFLHMCATNFVRLTRDVVQLLKQVEQSRRESTRDLQATIRQRHDHLDSPNPLILASFRNCRPS